MKLLLDCKHASRLVSQAQEERLSAGKRVRLWLHLRICDACSKFAAQLHAMREMLRRDCV